MNIEDKIKAAIIEALKGIPELDGCLPAEVVITDMTNDPTAGMSYHVNFYVPMPIPFAGA